MIKFWEMKKKKKKGPIFSCLDQKAWSTKELLFGFRGNFSHWTRALHTAGAWEI